MALIVFSICSALGQPAMDEIPGREITRWTTNGGQTVHAVEGQILVRVRAGTTPQQWRGALSRYSADELDGFPRMRTYLVSLPDGMTVAEGIQQWNMEACVEAAAPDLILHTTAIPNDPRYEDQYMWPQIKAPDAWDNIKGSSEVTVAIVDSGIDLDHEDLASKIWHNEDEDPGDGVDNDDNDYVDDWIGWDAAGDDNDPEPHPSDPTDPGQVAGASHGSHVAGLVGAATDNATGVAGVDWNCRLMAIRAMYESGAGTVSDVIEGIKYAAKNGADVINLSIGGGYTDMFDEPIQFAHENGCVVVVAAGNEDHEITDARNTWRSPVCNDGPMFTDNFVVGVAAIDDSDAKASFSNYDGSLRNFVDVSAPGVNVLSTLFHDPAVGFNQLYGQMSGTSMASPIVAGVAALSRARMPDATVDEIVSQIRLSADDIGEENPEYIDKLLLPLGAGRVNARGAVIDMEPRLPESVNAFDTQGDEGGSVTVVWSKSADDGDGFDDVTGYDILRATSEEGSYTAIETGLAPGTTIYEDEDFEDADGGGGDDTEYWYRVVVHDAVNTVETAPAGPAVPRDDLAPVPIENVHGRDTLADDGNSVTLNWSGYEPVEDVEAYDVYRSTDEFSSLEDAGLVKIGSRTSRNATTFTDDDSGEAEAPANGTSYWYAVAPVDDHENVNAAVTVVGPVIPSPNHTFNYPSGISMMAIGADTPEGDLAELLGIAQSELRAARYDPISKGYQVYDPTVSSTFMEHELGRAFWLRTSGSIVQSIAGIAGEEVSEGRQHYPVPFECHREGELSWNMIGNPFVSTMDVAGVAVRVGDDKMSLSKAHNKGLVLGYLWTWDSFARSYKLVSTVIGESWVSETVPKGRGFFFGAYTDGELLLPNPAYTGAESTRATGESDEGAVGGLSTKWKVRLVAETDEFADTDNFVGVSSSADELNQMPGPPIQGIDLSFDDGPKDVSGAALFVEECGEELSGKVTVESTQAGPVTIKWPDLSEVRRSLKPRLVDVVTGERIYMRTVSEYSYDADSGGRREFKLDFAPSDGAGLVVESMAAVPAGGGVQIVFSLSTDATVNVDVMNIAGRRVATIASSATAAGGEATTVSWDGVTKGGSLAPAGRYMIRVRAMTDAGEQVTAARSVNLRR